MKRRASRHWICTFEASSFEVLLTDAALEYRVFVTHLAARALDVGTDNSKLQGLPGAAKISATASTIPA